MRVHAWPPGRPRILVVDAWLANGGDGAIALATQERLRRLAPDAAILHAAYQGDLLEDAYPGLALVPPLAGLLGITPDIPEIRGLDAAAAWRLVAEADVVLSQGGGFAMEHYDPWERLRAWEVVVEMGVALGFGAQSVGMFHRPRERAILRRVYGAAAVVAVRDPDSADHVIALGAPPSRVMVTADEVFGLIEPTTVAPPDRRGIACVLSAHPQARRDGSMSREGGSHERLGALVGRLARDPRADHVTLLSTQQGLGHLGRGLEDDGELALRVVAGLRRSDARRVRVLEGYLAPLHCAEVIATHRGLVSMRMHAAIFGLCLGVPTVLVNESFKASMFAMAGLEDVVVAQDDAAAALARRRSDPWPPSVDAARRAAARNDEVMARLLAAAPVPAGP
jgi:polysaccharide pyruvyl transferase WcaK-like protein